MKTSLNTIRETLREHLDSSDLLQFMKNSPKAHQEQKNLRRYFFIKMRAKQHVDDGYPPQEWRVSLVPERNILLQRAIENYLVYLEGEKVKFEFGSKESNPYIPKSRNYSKRNIDLEAMWNAGFDGEGF